jgi:tRNA U34 5-methylaminomethyl-2-thiouridine-forming methyltransferase MnmC
MTSDTLTATLEQNYENLKALLDELEADYDLPADPKEKARMSKAFHPDGPEAAKNIEMAEEERLAWLFEENAKALHAAAAAAGARTANAPAVDESSGLDEVGNLLGGD